MNNVQALADRINNRVWDQVRQEIWDPSDYQVRQQLHYKLSNQVQSVYSLVRDQVDDRLRVINKYITIVEVL